MRRPQHLERRGAVYYFRVRIPQRLKAALGPTDFCKSLGTKDYATACRRCSAATFWFESTISRMGRMGAIDRETLEEAALSYFAELQSIADQPRDIPADYFDQELSFQIEMTRGEIDRLDHVLISKQFGPSAEQSARTMLVAIGGDFDSVDVDAQRSAMDYAVRAERQQMRYVLHSLREPGPRYIPDDEMFIARSHRPTQQVLETLPPPRPRFALPELTLEIAVEKFVEYRTKVGWNRSMREESLRVYHWLQEEIDPATPVEAITRDQMREFRDCLLDLAVGNQGKKRPFRERVGTEGQERLKFATRIRYWRFTKNLFHWLEKDRQIASPAGELPFEGGRGEVRVSPKPFSTDELKQFLSTPLFKGYQSPHRTKSPGNCLIRNGRWWSAIIMMFTGMRAGDVVQLLPGDFNFDDAVPHLLIQPGFLPESDLENPAKKRRKSSKFGVKTHSVPLHPTLLTLGLREFVEGRRKQNPNRRLIYEIGLGGNRESAGMTKYWSAYLHQFGLYKPRRATHVHPHTLINFLRAANARGEDIAAVAGHYGNYKETQTDQYGDPQGEMRKLNTLLTLDHGFDVVAALGGPYEPKVHRF